MKCRFSLYASLGIAMVLASTSGLGKGTDSAAAQDQRGGTSTPGRSPSTAAGGDPRVDTSGVRTDARGGGGEPLNAANTDNHWSGRQTFSAPVSLTSPFLTIYGAGQTGVDANPVAIINAVRDTPQALVQNILNVTTCHGNNRAFVGCSAGYFAAGDDGTVTPANKGVLYALALSTRPRVARGDSSPNDDANGLVVSNDGSANGTEAVYLGRNKAIANDWTAGIGIDANAVSGLYLTGTYTYGITFAHGPLARFAHGGGVLLVPRPDHGTTPLISLGSDAFAPANNATVMAVDPQGSLILPGKVHLCAGGPDGECAKQRAPLVVESGAGSGITILDRTASNAFTISTGTDAAGGLVFDRTAGVGPVAFNAPIVTPAARLVPTTFGALPPCHDKTAGTMAYITDASAKITAWHQQVTGGNGANRAFLTCNGTGWFAFSY